MDGPPDPGRTLGPGDDRPGGGGDDRTRSRGRGTADHLVFDRPPTSGPRRRRPVQLRRRTDGPGAFHDRPRGPPPRPRDGPRGLDRRRVVLQPPGTPVGGRDRAPPDAPRGGPSGPTDGDTTMGPSPSRDGGRGV